MSLFDTYSDENTKKPTVKYTSLNHVADLDEYHSKKDECY